MKLKRLASTSCPRWSMFAPFLLYFAFFTLVRFSEIPLRSDDATKVGVEVRTRDENIIEYLHRLHNRKPNDEAFDEDEKDKAQPFYALEEIFHNGNEIIMAGKEWKVNNRKCRLREVKKADYNRDNYLNLGELSKWINTKTQEHIHEAIVDNYKVFMAIDVRPKNGIISWEEYHSYFLQKNGLNKSYVAEHSERHKELPRGMRDTIMRDKAAWSECAKSDPDYLTLDEFLSFRHPESSHSTIISLVEEIFRKFDRDGDDVLTEEEFSTLQSDDESEKSELVHQEESERRREFRDSVDEDKDGRVSRREMMTYIDPKNPRHAREEAETLFGLADLDRDGRLSLVEIFNKMDLFLGSKMVDTARSFHDEF